MKKLLFVFLFTAMGMGRAYSQALVQTYTDRCTGQTFVFSVPMEGQTVVAFYNKSRVFTALEFQNGTLQAWLEETYRWWVALSPCSSTATGATATQQNTSNTTQQATQAATNAANNTAANTTANATTGATSTPPTNTSQTNTTNTGTDNTNTNPPDNSTSGASGNSTGNDSTTSSGSEASDTTTQQDSSSTEASSSETSQSSEETTTSDSTESSNETTGEESTETSGNEGEETSGSEETDSDSGDGNAEDSNEDTESEDVEESNDNETEEESNEETDESSEEDTEEESTEEESSEEEDESTEDEDSEEESNDETEEEDGKKKKKKRNLAPPIVTANVLSQQLPTGGYSQAVTFGVSQSSLMGTETYGINAMVYDNLQQYMITLNFSKVFINKEGRASLVYSAAFGGMKMYTTAMAMMNHSLVYLGKKGSVQGIALGTTLTWSDVYSVGGALYTDSAFVGASFTTFYTKPFRYNDKLTISPMIAASIPYLTYDAFTGQEVLTADTMFILGSNFTYRLTQRFGLNVGVNVIESTLPEFPTMKTFTIGGRLSF